MIQRVSNVAFRLWDELRAAIDQLHKPDNGYAELVAHHARKHRMHGSMQHDPSLREAEYKRFLPWHRAYLLKFEKALRVIDDTLTIPYWDWEVDKGDLHGFQDLLGDAHREIDRSKWFVGPDEVDNLISNNASYLDFAMALETGLHNKGHGWIGGTMNTMGSPKDPAFWFHHAQVDHIWARWQQKHEGELADLLAVDRKLDPWGDEYTVMSVNDISLLGYEYVRQ